MSGYTYDALEIAKLEKEIRRLEYEQQQLKQRYDDYVVEISEIDKKIESCRQKIDKYTDLVETINNYEYDRIFYRKKVIKKAIFPGVLGVVAGYILGGVIANAAVGAVLGTLTAIAAIAGAAILYCRAKLKKGREVAKRYNKKRLEKKINNETGELKKQKSLKETKGNDIKPVINLYQKNNEELSDLKLRHSIITNQAPVNNQQPKRPFQKRKK